MRTVDGTLLISVLCCLFLAFALHQASQAVWCMCMRALREPVCEIVFVTVACAAYSVLQTDYST